MTQKPVCCLCGGGKIGDEFEPRHLKKCLECGLVFVWPQQSALSEEGYGDVYYDTFAGSENDLGKMWKDRLKVVLKHKRQGNLLDVGAGTGQFLGLAKKYFTVQGTEVSDYAGKKAKANYDVLVEIKDLKEFNKESFDVVTAWHVIEHLTNPTLELGKMHRLLTPGGYLFLALPNNNSLKQRIKKLISYPSLYFDAAPSRENHFFFFTRATILRALEKNGFTVKGFGADNYYGDRSILTSVKFFISDLLTADLSLEVASSILIVAKK